MSPPGGEAGPPAGHRSTHCAHAEKSSLQGLWRSCFSVWETRSRPTWAMKTGDWREEEKRKWSARGKRRATGVPHSCWAGVRLPLPLHLALGCLHSVPWCREVAGLKVVNEPRFLLCHFQLV